ncbi:hypothetical protein Tco_0127323 [Tanacetum coccineum]
MRIIISDRNRKETSLKSELHSAQLQLRSTLNHHKRVREEAIMLKKDFKQKEDKFLEEFLDIKRLKEKVEDRLYKQDQSIQTVHMICKPKSFYDEKNKVAIGYKNPLCLTRAKQVQPALYNGHVLVMSNHARPVVHDSEDTREISEITRKRMLEKMKSPLCVENKVRIAPPDYSKENLLATFAPQRNLTPEQIFWSIDNNNRKKAETLAPKPISALTVYPPNTPVKLVPRILPTKKGERCFEQTKKMLPSLKVFHISKLLKHTLLEFQKSPSLKKLKKMEEIFDQMNNEVDKEYNLEADMSKVHDELKHISKLERENINLQLKYQHLQESFDNKKSQASQEAPDFNSFFKIKNLEHQIQEKDNVIRDLKVLVLIVELEEIEDLKAQLEGKFEKFAARSFLVKTKDFFLLLFEQDQSQKFWKATGKLFANVGYQWRPTGKKFTSGKLNCGYQWRPTGKKFALGELCPLTRIPVTCGTDHPVGIWTQPVQKLVLEEGDGSYTHHSGTRA